MSALLPFVGIGNGKFVVTFNDVKLMCAYFEEIIFPHEGDLLTRKKRIQIAEKLWNVIVRKCTKTERADVRDTISSWGNGWSNFLETRGNAIRAYGKLPRREGNRVGHSLVLLNKLLKAWWLTF